MRRRARRPPAPPGSLSVGRPPSGRVLRWVALRVEGRGGGGLPLARWVPLYLVLQPDSRLSLVIAPDFFEGQAVSGPRGIRGVPPLSAFGSPGPPSGRIFSGPAPDPPTPPFEYWVPPFGHPAGFLLGRATGRPAALYSDQRRGLGP